jgi:hypothetical protein
MESVKGRRELSRGARRALRIIGVVGIVLLIGMGSLFIVQELSHTTILGGMNITDYTFGEMDEGVWFAIYVKNSGFSYDTCRVTAEVTTPSSIYSNSTMIGVSPGQLNAAYLLVELPPDETGPFDIECHLME